jgi:hypothetical protein
MRLVADAITRAGSTEGKRVRDALASTPGFMGVTGNSHVRRRSAIRSRRR